jgi:uncharacterized iron-regulated membrane protein
MLRLSHILTTAALVAVCAAPASAATFEQLQGSDKSDGGSKPAADTGWRSSYQPAPASNTSQGQDLRSPDAVDAAAHRGIYAGHGGATGEGGSYVLNRDYGSPDAADRAPAGDPRSYVLNRDYGSPDAADAARDLPPVQTAVLEPRDVSSGGFDWGDAGIGAAGMLAIFSIAAGFALLLTGRKRRHGIA